MEESQIKQIIEQQPLHGSALLDPRCKILLLVCIGFVSYFLAGEVVSLALMLVYGLFIAVGNGGKWALKMIVVYIIVAYYPLWKKQRGPHYTWELYIVELLHSRREFVDPLSRAFRNALVQLDFLPAWQMIYPTIQEDAEIE